MRLPLLTFAAVLTFGLMVVPTAANAGWVEFFFPMLKDTSNDPSNTLRAPFAEPEEADTETAQANDGPDGETQAPPKPNAQSHANQTVPMQLSHRSDREVGQWVTTAVSEAITFTEADTAAEMEGHKKLFDKAGWDQLQAFLTNTNMMNVIKSDRYQMRSYVRGKPILLNEGSVGGRYRWLYEVSANISYLERNVSDYKGVEPENRTLKIMVQIGRNKDADNEIGLLIERWDGKIVKETD